MKIRFPHITLQSAALIILLVLGVDQASKFYIKLQLSFIGLWASRHCGLGLFFKLLYRKQGHGLGDQDQRYSSLFK